MQRNRRIISFSPIEYVRKYESSRKQTLVDMLRKKKKNKREIKYTKETCVLFRGTAIYNEHHIYVKYHPIEHIESDV